MQATLSSSETSSDRIVEKGEHVRRVVRIASLLDAEIRVPVIGYRIGLDGILGLIPGIGDAASAAISLYLVHQAQQAGLESKALFKMLRIATFDFVLGLVPVVGDLFDFGYKSNKKISRILLQELGVRETLTPGVTDAQRRLDIAL